MKLISFSLCGKMAHFRKYYSNSSALSYLLPPVTTVKGILAGLLGYERDQYYAQFSHEQCKIGISIQTPIRKITQTMNLLKVEKPQSDLIGAGQNRTQNNTEWVVPRDIREGWIQYGIYVWHREDSLLENLYELVEDCAGGYQSKGAVLALGSAQCLGWIANGKKLDVQRESSAGELLRTTSAVPVDKIASIHASFEQGFNLMKEETLLEFDEHRQITEQSKRSILITPSSFPVELDLKEGAPYYRLPDQQIIMLLE